MRSTATILRPMQIGVQPEEKAIPVKTPHQKILTLFNKQTPVDRLRILLSKTLKRSSSERTNLGEDPVHFENLNVHNAFCLKVDPWPISISEMPQFSNAHTLRAFHYSPFTQNPYQEQDIISIKEWMCKTPQGRFVLVVRQQLAPSEQSFSDAAIIKLLKDSYLEAYQKPIFSLMQRLDKIYPWIELEVPENIKELRQEIAKHFFDNLSPSNVSFNSLSAFVKQLEANHAFAEQKEREAIEKRSGCLSCFNCF